MRTNAGPRHVARETPTYTRWARGNDWSPIERRRSSTWRLPPPLGARAASRPADARTTPPAHPILHRYRRTTVSYLWLFATTPHFSFSTLPLSLRLFNPFATPWRLSERNRCGPGVLKSGTFFRGERGECDTQRFLFFFFFVNGICEYIRSIYYII